MQFNIIFKTIFEYIHKKFHFVHTNTFCKYRKKLRASPRMHLVIYINVPGTQWPMANGLITSFHICPIAIIVQAHLYRKLYNVQDFVAISAVQHKIRGKQCLGMKFTKKLGMPYHFWDRIL